MSGVTVSGDGFQVDAALLADAFGLAPEEVRERMRSGAITSRFETGTGSDEGRFRLSFRHAGQVLRLTVDGEGHILSRARFPERGRG